jgi:lysozyme family protein
MRPENDYGLRLLIRDTLKSEYHDFLLEREFEAIFDGLNVLLEAGTWTGPNTYEWEPEPKKGTPDQPALTFTWDLTDQKPGFAEEMARKTKSFLEKLPKEKVQEYFVKFLEKVKSLPKQLRRKILLVVGGVFLTFASLSSLTSSQQFNADPAMAQEFRQAVEQPGQDDDQVQDSEKTAKLKQQAGKSSFMKAQKHVKVSEAGYSDDRHDTGNWINVKGYGKRFVGTKFGISAPILAKYLGRLPKKEDMMKLPYETALKIYKKNYWDANNITHFSNQSIADILYDGCVNQGISGTKETMRNALNRMGVKISPGDDPFSMEWIRKANSLDQKTLFSNIKAERGKRYKSSDTFTVHGKGWLNRLGSLEFDPST